VIAKLLDSENWDSGADFFQGHWWRGLPLFFPIFVATTELGILLLLSKEFHLKLNETLSKKRGGYN